MASRVMILLEFFDGNSVVRLVPTQQAYDCYMPRVTGDLLMSNCQMLIGGACITFERAASAVHGLTSLETPVTAHTTAHTCNEACRPSMELAQQCSTTLTFSNTRNVHVPCWTIVYCDVCSYIMV